MTSKRSWTAIALAMGMSAAAPAAACIGSNYHELLLFDDVPPSMAGEEFVLRVKLTRFGTEDEKRVNGLVEPKTVKLENVKSFGSAADAAPEELELFDVYRHFVWADVKAVVRGTYSGRKVRIVYPDTSCGPFPEIGDKGLLIGHFELQRDRQPAFVARSETEEDRKLRKGQLGR